MLVLVLLGTMRFSGLERPQISQAEKAFRDLITPLQSGVDWVGRKFSNLAETVTSYTSLRTENQALKEQVEQLTVENHRLKESAMENARLERLLEFKQEVETSFELLPARVIGRDSANWYSTLTINAGEADGVAKDMVVINNQGLVGRVLSASAHSAQVLTILSREGPAAALLMDSRYPGIVEGINDGSGRLQLIHLPQDVPVNPQEPVITSGLGEVFPKGLRIGFVTEVIAEANGLMKKAIVQPYVDFLRLEEVLVITSAPGGGSD